MRNLLISDDSQMTFELFVWLLFFNIGLCHIIPGDQSVMMTSLVDPEPLDEDIYRNMFTYAHLIDISYCISSTSHIEPPFRCGLNCEERFPNVTLVHQWYFDDSVCGYIAVTHSNIFNYKETARKTIIVSLRGTRSLYDSYTDIKVDMVNYSNLGTKLRDCGARCRVHRGFYKYYLNTLIQIDKILRKELDEQEDYELLILGHSLGGAISLLLSLYYLDLGYDKMTVITMGQPLVGNQPFVSWADDVLGSNMPVVHDTFDRKYFRVIHKNDVVATIPSNSNIMDSYSQFSNQIYLNCSATETIPTIDQVVDCHDGENPLCIKKDFGKLDFFTHNYLQAHTTYFRSMGLCGIRGLFM